MKAVKIFGRDRYPGDDQGQRPVWRQRACGSAWKEDEVRERGSESSKTSLQPLLWRRRAIFNSRNSGPASAISRYQCWRQPWQHDLSGSSGMLRSGAATKKFPGRGAKPLFWMPRRGQGDGRTGLCAGRQAVLPRRDGGIIVDRGIRNFFFLDDENTPPSGEHPVTRADLTGV